jgi:hypothetical protein
MTFTVFEITISNSAPNWMFSGTFMVSREARVPKDSLITHPTSPTTCTNENLEYIYNIEGQV